MTRDAVASQHLGFAVNLWLCCGLLLVNKIDTAVSKLSIKLITCSIFCHCLLLEKVI